MVCWTFTSSVTDYSSFYEDWCLVAVGDSNLPHRKALEIKVFCQGCGAPQSFAPVAVGKRAKCLACGHVFRVPDTRTPEQTDPNREPKKTPHEPRSAPAVAGRSLNTPPEGQGEFDPLEELASSEQHRSVDQPAPHDDPETAPVTATSRDLDVISTPAVDPQATVTALGFMIGLFYLASLVIGIVLLHWAAGPVLTVWILLPPAVVLGWKVLTRIVFLLIGKAVNES